MVANKNCGGKIVSFGKMSEKKLVLLEKVSDKNILRKVLTLKCTKKKGKMATKGFAA